MKRIGMVGSGWMLGGAFGISVGLAACGVAPEAIARQNGPGPVDEAEPVQQQGTLGYYRQPAIHADTVVFVSEGDLWKVGIGGGVATRLTSHDGVESFPVISPDGSRVAFSAQYEGPTEVYVMPISGGLPQRVTWEGAGGDRRLRPVSWTPDGDLVYTTRAHSTLPDMQLVVADLDENTHELVELSQASDGVFSGDGTLFFTRLPFQGSHARRYVGGSVEQIWSFAPGDDEATPLTLDYDGTSRDPMWWDGRVYFTTDRDGALNIWSMRPDGTGLEQHTSHVGWDVLGPKQSGGRIVYQHQAGLRVLDLASGEDRGLPITIASDFDRAQERWITEPMDYLTDTDLSPNGDRVAMVARGEVFVAPAGEGRIVRVTRRPDVRYRMARFMPDGETLLLLSDESGEVEFWTTSADGLGEFEQVTDDAEILRWEGVPSPDGTLIAHTDKFFRLWMLDTETGESTLIEESPTWNITEMSWAPNGRWLLYTYYELNRNAVLRVYDAESGTTHQITTDRYNSFSGSWHPGGEWIYFLSDRNLRSLVGSPWGSRGPEPFFDREIVLMGVALQPGLKSPFAPETELDRESANEEAEEAAEGEPAEASGEEEPADETEVADESEDAEASDEPETIAIDFEGIQDRLIRLPAPAGNYSNLFVTESHAFFDSVDDLHGRETLLKSFELSGSDPELTTVASGIGSFQPSDDRSKMLIRKGNGLFIVPTSGGPVQLNNESDVDLRGWTMSFDPREEWRQMFVESWRLMRDYFYDRDMHSVDWQAELDRHLPLVDRVADRRELSDLIAQMVSEIGALHHFVYGGDLERTDERIAPASLGARLTRDENAGGAVIEHIFGVDPDEPERRGPLARMDLGIEVGDVITMINGVRVLDAPDHGALLRTEAGKQVRLRIKDGEDGTERDVIVIPESQGESSDRRYHEWEYTRRLRTEEASDGRIGYVHLRAMGTGDMADFVRGFYPVFQREGLIIDVRHNNGGNIDSWIISRLLRKAWSFWQGNAGAPYWNMQYAFRGHLAVLIDDNTASDGEAFAEGVKRLDLGEVIGMRSWGGGIWLTSSNYLVDGGIATAAEFGVFGPEGVWLIENIGVEPDIEVDNPPHETFHGADRQLDTAIEFLLKKIEKEPIPQPEAPEGKDLSLPAWRRR
ncbi:MAG: S41 family peptidase [Phycisphaerales bacterium]